VQQLVPIASPSPHVAVLAKPSAEANKLGSKVTLEVVDSPDEHDKPYYEPFELTVGDGSVAWAKMRMKLAGKPTWFPLEGFVILRKSIIIALVYGS
jgi:hypothetical protein